MKFNMHPSITEFLSHIKEETEFCIEKTESISFEDFQNDEVLSRAIVRSLEIIGEASKKLPPDFTSQFPLVPWKNMAGMRDRLIHHYFGVDPEIVWSTIKEDLPNLSIWLDPMIRASKGQ
jgi:uncharacterized protein with HEPN domain